MDEVTDLVLGVGKQRQLTLRRRETVLRLREVRPARDGGASLVIVTAPTSGGRPPGLWPESLEGEALEGLHVDPAEDGTFRAHLPADRVARLGEIVLRGAVADEVHPVRVAPGLASTPLRAGDAEGPQLVLTSGPAGEARTVEVPARYEIDELRVQRSGGPPSIRLGGPAVLPDPVAGGPLRLRCPWTAEVRQVPLEREGQRWTVLLPVDELLGYEGRRPLARTWELEGITPEGSCCPVLMAPEDAHRFPLRDEIDGAEARLDVLEGRRLRLLVTPGPPG